MKKVDGKYILKWYGMPTVLMIFLEVIFFLARVELLFGICFEVWLIVMIFMPSILQKKRDKKALEQEKSFHQRGFSYQQKFTAHDGVFYIDVNGRVAVIWKYNPDQLCMIDPSLITDIRTNDGGTLLGSYGVSCEFRLNGKKMKIWTLRVHNGYVRKKDPGVLEAISKADMLCQLLNEAKVNVSGQSMA